MKITNKNFLYNLLYQVFIFIIPLITIPYISRVLGVNNVGIYSYTYSIVNYFMLCAMLGINNYGSREIAKCNLDKLRMSKMFCSIYLLQFICSILMLIFYFILVFCINYEHKFILYLQSIYIISCCFDINWFFFGNEKFKITISRNIVIKVLSLICIFIFVQNKNQLWIYTLILSVSTLISQIYLWFYLKKEIIFIKPCISDIFTHFKKCLILFIPVIAYSVYRIMDKTMIGFLANTIQLGNYESAEKIISIPICIITSLGTVMLPHMSKMSNSEFYNKIIETFKLCFFMILPIFFGLFVVADDFCNIFFGIEFSLTPNIIRILLVTVIFSAITNVIRNNYLIPKSKDIIYVKSTIYGAIINLILNLIFIPRYGAYGACIGTIGAEFTVMMYQMVKTKNYIKYKTIFFNILPFVFSSILMSILIFIVGLLFKNEILKVIIQIVLAFFIYFILNFKYIRYDFFGKK